MMPARQELQTRGHFNRVTFSIIAIDRKHTHKIGKLFSVLPYLFIALSLANLSQK